MASNGRYMTSSRNGVSARRDRRARERPPAVSSDPRDGGSQRPAATLERQKTAPSKRFSSSSTEIIVSVNGSSGASVITPS